MKKAVIGFGIIVLLCSIGYVFFENQGNGEEKQKIVPKNPELFVDSNETRKSIAVTGEGKKQEKGDELVTGLETSLVKKDKGNNIQFLFVIKNNSEQERILQFTSSQRFEYEIYKGTELIERFSDGKSFMQVLKDVNLAPNETVSFDINVGDMEKGEYSIEVWPTAKGTAQLRQKLDFIVN